jgi:cellulose synthase/poly-beta-1,6-N-acetylglucosamine synthase-like glycosyltransferase
MQTVMVILFWICVACVVYVYAIYPPLIWLISRLLGRSPARPRLNDAELPALSLLIAAHNEESVIAGRIENALSLDYPTEKLEIVIASDGSRDATAEIVRRYRGRGVRLLDYTEQRGKSATLNAAIPQLRGEIVLLSDANTHLSPMSARQMAAWFADERVGVVCGRLRLIDAQSGRNVDGIYWKYETFLKRCEARLGALLGSNGAVYAIRRRLCDPLPAGTIVDDFVLPLQAKLRHDCTIVYDHEATAREESAPDLAGEFRRRCRIGTGGVQAMGMLWRLLDPRRGWVAFSFLSHKVLRWGCPFFMLAAVLLNILLIGQPLYAALLGGQLAFYLIALLGAVAPVHLRLFRATRLATMFVSMNAALLIGWLRALRGESSGIWQRTARAAESSATLRPAA